MRLMTVLFTLVCAVASTASAKDPKLCVEVLSQASSHDDKRIVQKWIQFLKTKKMGINPNGGLEWWEKRLDQSLAVYKRLKPYCDNKETLTKLESCVGPRGQDRLNGLYHKEDPVVWCKAVEKAQAATPL